MILTPEKIRTLRAAFRAAHVIEQRGGRYALLHRQSRGGAGYRTYQLAAAALDRMTEAFIQKHTGGK